MHITAVLLNLNGTLLDSCRLISEPFRQACRLVLNRNLTEAEVLEHWGSPLRVRFEWVNRSQTDALVDAYGAYCAAAGWRW